MILAPDDIIKFAPSINLSEDVLTGAILFVQSIIESSAGCNRPIEITTYEIIKKINLKFQSFFIPYLPIVQVNKIEIRLANIQDGFKRAIPTQQWFEISDYDVDINGQLHLSLRQNFYTSFSAIDRRAPVYSEVKANFTAGLDFSQDNEEINKLKMSAIECLKYTLNSGAFKGVSELDVPFDEFRIKYISENVQVGKIPDALLLPFKKYKPVGSIS